jgi:hypothetical protein
MLRTWCLPCPLVLLTPWEKISKSRLEVLSAMLDTICEFIRFGFQVYSSSLAQLPGYGYYWQRKEAQSMWLFSPKHELSREIISQNMKVLTLSQPDTRSLTTQTSNRRELIEPPICSIL